MTITINFEPIDSPGYTPRKTMTIFNVESIHDAGVRMIKVKMTFSDLKMTWDHVVSVSAKPDKETV